MFDNAQSEFREGATIIQGAGRPLQPSARQSTKEMTMNWDRIEGNWNQFKGHVKEQWGMLTDDQIDKIAGKRDQLVGKIQENYGCARDDAECQVSDWENRNQDVFAETAAEVKKHQGGLKGQ
jgi:uncharacterized protein YjbJ (UPF0337 family)